jgi:type VI secretion system secreted protein Hcp
MRVQHGWTMLLCKAVVVLIFLAIIVMPNSAWAAYDAFLQIEGIPGESMDQWHKDQIDILGWSFGTSVPSGSKPVASGSAGGKAAKRDLKSAMVRAAEREFRFTMKVNRASPKLFLAYAGGQQINEVTLSIRKAGAGKGEDYLIITLGNVLVSSFHTTGNAANTDDKPIDDITLNFDKIKFEYKQIKPNGKLGASTKAEYDFIKNVDKYN